MATNRKAISAPEASRGSTRASFANPVEPQYTNPAGAGYVNCAIPSCMVSPVLGNTRRNMLRGPGVTQRERKCLSAASSIYR